MKKILLTLGSIAAIATPVAAVVSCGSGRMIGPDESYVEKYTLSKTTEQEIKAAIVQSLSIPEADLRFPFAGSGYKLGALEFDCYARIFFRSNSSFDAGNGTKSVKAQESIVIGRVPSNNRSAGTSNIKVMYINEYNFTEDLTPTLASKNKLATIESAMTKVVAEVEEKEKKRKEEEAAWEFMHEVDAKISHDDPTLVIASVIIVGGNAQLPTHLPEEDVEALVNQLKKLDGINNVKQINCHYILSARDRKTELEWFHIKVPVGRATDFYALSTAAAAAPAIIYPEEKSEASSGTTQPSSGASQSSTNGAATPGNAPQ